MSPGGHLLTTLAACAASAFLSRDLPVIDSLALAGGIGAGGFLIDVDHAIDYVLFEGQRDLRPSAFLRHYLEGRDTRAVLVLHSYELFGLLGLLAWYLNALALWGYLMGALMHLALDIIYNREMLPRNIGAFYSFTYRLAHRFDTAALAGSQDRFTSSKRFWSAFFVGSKRVDLDASPAMARIDHVGSLASGPPSPPTLGAPRDSRGAPRDAPTAS